MSDWWFIREAAGMLRPVFDALEGWLGDWGLAVILFTLLVRAALLPLSIRQARLSADQMVFSRHLRERQASWKGTKEEWTAEVAALMQKHRVNPLGMFATALVQSPVFVTVYLLFSQWGHAAPSMLVPWVASIGLPDPTWIVPLGAAVLNGLSTWVSLTPADWAGAAPSRFTFGLMFGISLLILWSAPVAMSLYYGTSTLWGTVERKLFGRWLHPRMKRKLENLQG